jgi:hypothetical protein
MEIGTYIKWNNNLIANDYCYGLYLQEINETYSEVICTSVGKKPAKMKLQVETKLIQIADEQL